MFLIKKANYLPNIAITFFVLFFGMGCEQENSNVAKNQSDKKLSDIKTKSKVNKARIQVHIDGELLDRVLTDGDALRLFDTFSSFVEKLKKIDDNPFRDAKVKADGGFSFVSKDLSETSVILYFYDKTFLVLNSENKKSCYELTSDENAELLELIRTFGKWKKD